jgi:hypothetical protein
LESLRDYELTGVFEGYPLGIEGVLTFPHEQESHFEINTGVLGVRKDAISLCHEWADEFSANAAKYSRVPAVIHSKRQSVSSGILETIEEVQKVFEDMRASRFEV